MSDCTTCKHAYIRGDDRYIGCDIDNGKMSFPNDCSDEYYEERDDGLVLTQVWDWR